MSVEVIILLEGSDEMVATADHPWYESDLGRIDRQRWGRLAAEISSRAAGKESHRVDVFLHFKGDHLVGRFEYDFAEALIGLAREHSWGGEIFLALDQSIFREPDEITGNFTLLSYWLEVARRSRASDVILVNHSRGNPAPPSPLLLKKAGGDSRKRYLDLLSLISPGRWCCWAVPQSAIKRFSFVGDSLSPGAYPPANNFLIALDRKTGFTEDEENRIKRFVNKNRGGRFALAVVGIAAGDVSPAILALAGELSLKVLKFRGWLELRFFLLRLNELSEAGAVLWNEGVRAVSKGAPPLFDPGAKLPPGLLVTSAFNHRQDPALCRESARDVGRLLHSLHPNSVCRVHPATRAEDMPALVTGMDNLTAWWFMGHGRAGAVLQDNDGRALRAGDWLHKFAGYNGRLPLAFFSACRSAEVARAFARAGADVAVGFDSDTLPAPCRLLAIEVINAALASRGERDAILTAFSSVCRRLGAGGLGHINPVAFYATH